jgi:uncharacterized protein
LIPRIIGVVHLLPLPGSPGFKGPLDLIVDRAVQDCKSYVDGGLDGIIVENFGDVPFSAGPVHPVTVAGITRAAAELKKQFPAIHFGINVLRNDAESALSIAYVTGAEFIRVNVHVGAVVADQGIIQGKAYETLRLKKSLDSEIEILADIDVKHSAQIGSYDIRIQAADALERGLADAIVISGPRTGQAVDIKQLRELRREFATAKIVIGSGADSRNVKELLKYADSIIVGTSVKTGGKTSNPVDPKRLKDFMRAART